MADIRNKVHLILSFHIHINLTFPDVESIHFWFIPHHPDQRTSSLIYKTAMSPPKAAAIAPDPAAHGKTTAPRPLLTGARLVVPEPAAPPVPDDVGAGVVSEASDDVELTLSLPVGVAEVSVTVDAGEAVPSVEAGAELSSDVVTTDELESPPPEPAFAAAQEHTASAAGWTARAEAPQADTTQPMAAAWITDDDALPHWQA